MSANSYWVVLYKRRKKIHQFYVIVNEQGLSYQTRGDPGLISQKAYLDADYCRCVPSAFVLLRHLYKKGLAV